MKIGFVGFGKMAQALYLGYSKQSANRFEVWVCDPNKEAQKLALSLKAKLCDLNSIAQQVDVLFISVKPQQLTEVLEKLSFNQDGLIVSIVAGKRMASFSPYCTKELAFVRVMPNTPACLGKGATGLFFSEQVTDNQKAWVTGFFDSVGKSYVLTSEEELDIITALSGSGPAFCYQIAKDWAAVAQQHGFDQKKALAIIAQTFIGAGEMLLANPQPETLIEQVRSKGGTTAAGLDAYNAQKGTHVIEKMIENTILRSKAL